MDLGELREAIRRGRSVFDLPLRVTFYARVSTDKEEQQSSLENQVRYYRDFIRRIESWQYVEGYVDEGISGAEAGKRESFLRMIRDAEAGCFDFIVTKEISRFSRSTLDSILYTRRLLDCGVGVLFQNDGINTLDGDSEFRLVIMAGVAQDELRKLSERLKFGFRESIRQGRVLGNDRLWGYEKKDGVLSVNEGEAELVRRVFQLYAEGELGIRRLSRRLYDEGFRGRDDGPLSQSTLRSILKNPKYKGWYCGGKSRSADYRTKKKESIPEEAWVCYPSPDVPAVVSEELWERANAIYRLRSRKGSAEPPPGRYPYSGKVICGVHGECCHRRRLISAGGETESWSCRVYREKGRAGCGLPSVRSLELNAAVTELLRRCCDRDALIALALRILSAAAETGEAARAEERELKALHARRERLLELRLEGALTPEEFRRRHEALAERLSAAEQAREARRAEEKESAPSGGTERLRKELERELSFEKNVHTDVAAALLERVTILPDSAGRELHLSLRVRGGKTAELRCRREKASLCFLPSL